MKNLPPLPWSYQTNSPAGKHEGLGFVYLLDADGRKIGTFWGTPDEKLATATLVCDASDEALKAERRADEEATYCPAVDAGR